VDTFWKAVTQFKALQTANGRLAARRQQQSLAWMWERIDAGLKQAFRQDPQVSASAARPAGRGDARRSRGIDGCAKLLALAAKGWDRA
jgi:LAO/AO transport system kinase